MTKKHLNPLEDPPTASSSDDDEVETSAEEEDDDSSSEEDEPTKDLVKIPGKSADVSTNKGSDSDSGSETETDSDSETPNPGSGKTVSLSAVKPKEDLASSAALALPAKKSGAKRPASEGTTSRDVDSTKRVKKVTSGDDENPKKPAFQRLWSEVDEIAVLQGIIDFKADTGKSFYEDTNGFYEFIKKSISFEVSKNQFMDKIRSLKKKYIGKQVNGVEPSFVKAHDKKAFGLSKSIWGPEGIALDSNVKSNGVSKKSQSSKKIASVKKELFVTSPDGEIVGGDDKVLIHGGNMRKSDWFENSFLARSITGLGVDEHSVKQRWSLVPVESKKKIEEKLKLLQAKELNFVLEKTGLVHEITSMIVEASKNKTVDM